MKNTKEIDEVTRSYLHLQNPKELRGNLITFFILFLNIFGLLPIVASPFSAIYFWAAIIPIGLLHLAAIPFIIAPFKFEQIYYLFFGIYGVINTYVYFLAIQKLLYVNVGVENNIYFVIGVILFVCLLIVFHWFNHKMLYSGRYAKLQKNGTKVNVSPIVAASGIGYVIAQLILSISASDSITYAVIIIGVSFFSILTAFFSIYIHRYFFIRKNYESVKRLYPDFGLPKNVRKSS